MLDLSYGYRYSPPACKKDGLAVDQDFSRFCLNAVQYKIRIIIALLSYEKSLYSLEQLAIHLKHIEFCRS